MIRDLQEQAAFTGQYTIQLFGAGLTGCVDLNLERDVSVVSRLPVVSPFTVAAEADPSAIRGLDNKAAPATKLDASKQFSAALASANADYLVVDLSGALLPVVQRGRTWYTHDDSRDRQLEPGLQQLNPVLDKPAFVLWRNFKAFTTAVLENYAPEQILLVRSHVSCFFWDGRQVAVRDDVVGLRAARGLLTEADKRFVRATGCGTVDIAAEYLPLSDAPTHDVSLGRDFTIAIDGELTQAFRSPAGRPSRRRPPSFAFADRVVDTLANQQSIEPAKISKALRRTDDCWESQDAVAVAALVARAPNLDWSDVAAKLVSGGAGERTRRHFNANLRVLRAHPFTFIEGLTDTAPPDLAVHRLVEGWRLIARSGTAGITVERYRADGFDPQAFVAGGSELEVKHIDHVLESWPAYFERGRRNDRKPIHLRVRDREELDDFLSTFDVAEILSNENLVFTVAEDLPVDIEWAPKVDVSFLFDRNARVVCLRSGFGDQLYYYVFARHIADTLDLRLYVDDLLYDNDEFRRHTPHTRPDILPFVRADGIFSERLSPRLRRSRQRDTKLRRDNRSEYHDLGLREMVLATDRMHLKICLDAREVPSPLTVQVVDLAGYEMITARPPGVLFLDVLAKEGLLKYRLLSQKALWESALTFGEYRSVSAHEVAEKMRGTDAIVVHIRRGDRIALGVADSDDYYRDFIQRTTALTSYSNKHWFVFSDDIDYCRTHRAELGLDLAGENLTFVEGNNHFASMDDFQLMAQGKVVVCGKSGFSACAAMVSTRVEHIFGTGYSLEPGGDSWHRAGGEQG